MTGEFESGGTTARGGSAFANFRAVFRAELLYNRRRFAPYVAAALAACGALIYSLNLGFNNPLYNPVLYQLWTPHDLAAAPPRHLLAHRLYTLALAAHCLALAHLFFGRKLSGLFWRRGRPRELGWSILATMLTAAAAAGAGFLVVRM